MRIWNCRRRIKQKPLSDTRVIPSTARKFARIFRISFILTDKVQVKRLDFLDMGKDDTEGDVDPAEQFDIDFAVMAGELSNLLKDLTGVLGKDSAAPGDWGAQSKVA
jgi:DNA recombination-dependent growth factor C